MYLDRKIGNVQKYLALVPPASPARNIDLGTISTGLTFTPAVANSIGTNIQELPRWVQPYKHLILRVRGTIGGAGAAGGGTLRQQWRMYNILQRVELVMNGGDTFFTLQGSSLHVMNLLHGQYRNTEPLGVDVVPAAAPGAGASVAFDFSYKIPFHDPLLHPRLFNLLNAYEGHGVTSFQMRTTWGSIADFLTGDAGAQVTVTDIQLTASVMDYQMLAGFGVPYMTETEFARFETRELLTTLSNTTDIRTKLNRGLYCRGLILMDLDANQNAIAANNITRVRLTRDNIDQLVQGVRIPHIQRQIADRYSNAFQQGTNRTAFYFIDLAPDREVTQLINTWNMVDWDLFVDAGAAGTLRIIELSQNIPTAFIPRKDSRTTKMLEKGAA